MKLVVLCVVVVQVHAVLLMVEEERRVSPTHHIFRQTADLWNPEKHQTLFARRGLAEYERSQAMKPLNDPVLKAPRCSRLKENCAPDSHSHCCDPCASCHCRFFNAICRCWRLGRPCQRKT
ncbi:agouti-related protein-like isoform X1 [Ictalurus furcatus]|uniref:agouti-related protein-like isoform X1 n=1 Tax=Ictalurus furcatus TaxID=66913 RepID=UPI000F3A5E07|nr:agouti-related protein-like isoform X1 [Ictalurus furcatus]